MKPYHFFVNFFFLALFLYSSISNATDDKEIRCLKSGKISSSDMSPPKEGTKSSYCWNLTSQYFLSYECHLRRNCMALKQKPNNVLPELPSQIGTPQSRLCLQASGKVLFIRYWNEKLWQSQAICQFKDRSYIGLEYFSKMNSFQ